MQKIAAVPTQKTSTARTHTAALAHVATWSRTAAMSLRAARTRSATWTRRAWSSSASVVPKRSRAKSRLALSGLQSSLRTAAHNASRNARSLRVDDVRGHAVRFGSNTQAFVARTSENVVAHCARLAEIAAPRERFDRVRADARSFAQVYSNDERQALALLILPFLVVATAIVVHQSVRSLHAYMTLASVQTPDTLLAPMRQPAPPLGPAIDPRRASAHTKRPRSASHFRPHAATHRA